MATPTTRTSTTRRLRVILVLLGGIALFSCARRLMAPVPVGGGAPVRTTVAKAVPKTAPGPRIDHAKHLGKGLECVDCHGPAEGKTEPSAITYAACADCHDDEDKPLPEAKRIKNLFFKPDGSPAWTRAVERYDPEVRWAHAPHLKIECTTCHANLDVIPRRVAPLFDMAGCIACHAQKSAPNTCAACHKMMRGDTPPRSHTGDWRRTHGAAAVAGTERCETCHHDASYCDRCHQTTAPASHSGPWLQAHGAVAIARGERCEMCHVDPQTCVRCHLATPPASHLHLWRERHGQVALSVHGRQQGRCELCHLDPNFCEHCHAVEPPRNHTHLFRIRTHGVLASVDRTKCQVCHETDFCIRCHEGTPPRSHGALWASGPNRHCVQCHFPIAFEGSCRTCHFEEPTHSTAPDQPAWHTPGMNCRSCHTPAGGGAPPLRHLDNGTQCEMCHH